MKKVKFSKMNPIGVYWFIITIGMFGVFWLIPAALTFAMSDFTFFESVYFSLGELIFKYES